MGRVGRERKGMEMGFRDMEMKGFSGLEKRETSIVVWGGFGLWGRGGR